MSFPPRRTGDVSEAISQHVSSSRALYTHLVTDPLMPTAASAAPTGEPSAPTLAYLASSVASTAARIARLETAHLSIENRSLALANLNARRPEINFVETIKPLSNSVQQHEAVLADLLAVVNRMATTLERKAAESPAKQDDDEVASKRSSRVQQQQQQQSAAAAATAAAGVSFLDGDVSPLTRASEGGNASRLQQARQDFLAKAGQSPSGNTTLLTTSETASPAKEQQRRDNDDDEEENDEETGRDGADGGGSWSSTGFGDETSASVSNVDDGMRGGGGSPADPYSRAYKALRSTLDG